MAWYYIALICVAAYLVGSINFATIICKIKNTNIKSVGSGNPGTMNVLRSVGKVWGVLTFILDALKGVIFALIGRYLIDGPNNYDMLFLLGMFVIIGHIYPIFDKFKGGKGVASSMGIFMVASPIAGPITLVVLIGFLFLCKYGFIGSLLAVTFMCIFSCCMHPDVEVIIVTVAIWCFVVFAHRGNIARLIKGTENTLDLKKKSEAVEIENKEDAQKTEQNKED